MLKTRKVSPARSHDNPTSRRSKSRGTRSVGSPANSTTSERLSSIIQFKEKNISFALSPLATRRSVLNDDTEVEEPKRRSWWKNLGDNSRDMMEVMTNNKVLETNEAVEDYIDIEVLSQEKKHHSLDIPDSSDSESINSIVIPQRKLFTQKDAQQQNKYGQLIGTRESLAKLHKTGGHDKTLKVAPKNLFNQPSRPKSKPIFPAALLVLSPDKTINKTKETAPPEIKRQVRNLFGNQLGAQRKNIFADFIVSESEDEISEIQPKVFGFQTQQNTSLRRRREPSPTSSVTTDIEMDDWKLLPSSTMVENQIEDMMAVSKTPKRPRLSNLKETKESEAAIANNSLNNTKISNKVTTPNKSKSNSSLTQSSMMTRNRSKMSITQNESLSKSKSKNKTIADKEHADVFDGKELSHSSKHTKNDSEDRLEKLIEVNNQNAFENDDEENNEKLQYDTSGEIGEEESQNEIEKESLNEDEREPNNEGDEKSENEDKETQQSEIEVDSENEVEVESENEVEVESENEVEVESENEVEVELENEIESENEVEVESENEVEVEPEKEVESENEVEIESENEIEENETENEVSEKAENEIMNINENETNSFHNDQQYDKTQTKMIQRQNKSANVIEKNENSQNNKQPKKTESVINDLNYDNVENEVSDNYEGSSQKENDKATREKEILNNVGNELDYMETGEENEEIEKNISDIEQKSETDDGLEENNEGDEDMKDNEEDEEIEENLDESQLQIESDEIEQEIDTSQEQNEEEVENHESTEKEQEQTEDNIEEAEDQNPDESGSEIEDTNEDELQDNDAGNSFNDQLTTDRSHNSAEEDNTEKSPEAILRNKTKEYDSFGVKNSDTSLRRTSIMKNLNLRPSLAPGRDSVGFSDGSKNSTAEGSGWDSHRTTRKTLRQTFGKDFTPRKSLRALVMEKSAKRQTVGNDLTSITSKFPQANSTEFPEDSNFNNDTNHENVMSPNTRQTKLEMYLQRIKKDNLERRLKMEEVVKNSLKAPIRDVSNTFKMPSKPMFPVKKQNAKVTTKSQAKQIKTRVLFEDLPPEVLEDMKYKPPKRFQPSNAAWITKRLYKYFETKLEPKYDYKARVRAEKLVENIYHFAKDLRRHEVASTDSVELLKEEMARLEIVNTHFEFYQFFHDFMPREIRVKVVPDVVNKIPMPRHGVFSEIIRGNTVQG